MQIEEQINTDIKNAMLAKEAGKLEALRAIKSAVLLLKTSSEGLTEESANKAMQKMVKQREETAEIYKQQNRLDLAEPEIFQANIIKQYLPKQMDEAEIKIIIKEIISQVGATSIADLGKVMGVASKQLSGKADGKIISTLTKELLS
jgi:uncharacterized protein